MLLNKVDLLDVENAVDERRAKKARERLAQYGPPEDLLQRWQDEFPGATVLPVSARSAAWRAASSRRRRRRPRARASL